MATIFLLSSVAFDLKVTHSDMLWSGVPFLSSEAALENAYTFLKELYEDVGHVAPRPLLDEWEFGFDEDDGRNVAFWRLDDEPTGMTFLLRQYTFNQQGEPE